MACVEVICKYYLALHKGLEPLWNWLSGGNLEIRSFRVNPILKVHSPQSLIICIACPKQKKSDVLTGHKHWFKHKLLWVSPQTLLSHLNLQCGCTHDIGVLIPHGMQKEAHASTNQTNYYQGTFQKLRQFVTVSSATGMQIQDSKSNFKNSFTRWHSGGSFHNSTSPLAFRNL